jgi:hypothetical protein
MCAAHGRHSINPHHVLQCSKKTIADDVVYDSHNKNIYNRLINFIRPHNTYL